MRQKVLQKIVLLILLCSLRPGKLQEDQPTVDEGNNAALSAVFDEIKTLMSAIKSTTNTHIREFRTFKNQIEGNIVSLREDLSSLNDSVNTLSTCLQEHKQQTAAELAQLQTSLATTQFSLTTHTQEVNSKLSTLTTSLNHHKQNTAGELGQLQMYLNATQSSLKTTSSKLDTMTSTIDQLSTDHQLIQTSILGVNCMGTEEGLQLHQNLLNNLTHQLSLVNPHTVSALYTCGGTGGWRRVVYLDMTDPNTTCPLGWSMTEYSKRTCGRRTSRYYSCDSVTFPVGGIKYSRVCGRIKAYQWGNTPAFLSYHHGRRTSIDGAYASGVSVTHGSPRQHIWTFASGAAEGDTSPYENRSCPCDADHTIRVPPFVGNDYFCESGLNGPWNYTLHYIFHSSDPLWDGQDCLFSSTCCSLHNPPYFVKQLPTPTSDDIEARICMFASKYFENLAVEQIELYVQ